MITTQLNTVQVPPPDEIRTHDAITVANWFVDKMVPEGMSLYVTSLLKLIYISHGWHLEMFNGMRLIRNPIAAWKYGPVIEGVYDAFTDQERPIRHPAPAPADAPAIGPRQTDFLGQIVDIYGGMSARTLTRLTHKVGGPWDIVMREFGPYAVIPDALILAHYKAKRKAAEKSDHA